MWGTALFSPFSSHPRVYSRVPWFQPPFLPSEGEQTRWTQGERAQMGTASVHRGRCPRWYFSHRVTVKGVLRGAPTLVTSADRKLWHPPFPPTRKSEPFAKNIFSQTQEKTPKRNLNLRAAAPMELSDGRESADSPQQASPRTSQAAKGEVRGEAGSRWAACWFIHLFVHSPSLPPSCYLGVAS